MELRFVFSGSLICSTEADCVPPTGSEVVIRTESYKKGLYAGSLISFPVSDEFPTVFDFSEGRTIVSIDVNNYRLIEEGPPPPE